MNHTLKIKTFQIIALSGIIILNSCGQKADKTSTQNTAKSYPPVETTTIQTGDIGDYQTMNAYSQYLSKQTVRAPISGFLVQVFTDVGQSVRNGEQLFAMRTQEAAALAGTKLRNDSILDFGGTIPVNAPKGGIINSIQYRKDAFVQQGDPLAELISPSDVVFILNVPFDQVDKVRQNLKVEIELPGRNPVPAHIGNKLPLTKGNGQVQSYLIHPDADIFVPENLNATIRLKTNEHTSAQLLPRKAVLSNETMDKFWVMKLMNDTLAIRVDVSLGLQTDSLTEILKPQFTKSDQILVNGQYGLEDSTRVQLIKNAHN